jgi:glycosyltransferase involved in cell wall biosynthesis
VLAQAGVNVRVLIIDDASSDETAQLGANLAAADSRVFFHRHVLNKGHIATYNEGLIDWSNADYTMLLSADDLLAPGALRRAVAVMEADKSIGMVYGWAVHFFQEADLPQVEPENFTHVKYLGQNWIAGRCAAGTNVITSPEVVVRGSIQRAVGGYRPELPHAGDLEMWLRIAAISNIGYVRGPAQAYYRVHSASMQRTKYQSSLSDFVQRKAAFDCFYTHHQAAPKARQWNDFANRSLAGEALWDVCRAYDHDRVDPARIDELVDFALSAYPQAKSLPEYKALQRRRRLGAAFCHRTQLFLVPASLRWADRWWKKQRWQRFGV